LIKRFGLGAIHEALEHDGTILDSLEGTRRDGLVITDKVEFRQLGLPGKIELAGMCYADFAPVDGEHLWGFFFAHENRLHETFAVALSRETSSVPRLSAVGKHHTGR
jgi:hypothetical protein